MDRRPTSLFGGGKFSLTLLATVLFALCALGHGLLTRLDAHSTTGYWVSVQFLVAAGLGFLFTRVDIPSAIFNSHVNTLLPRLSDLALRAQLANGGAYSLASKELMQSLNSDRDLKVAIVSSYADSLKLTWQVAIDFCLLGFVISLIIEEIALRQESDTKFGIDDKKEKKSGEGCRHKRDHCCQQ